MRSVDTASGTHNPASQAFALLPNPAIVIVGAGAAGLSFAYYLSKMVARPFTCTIVDPDTKESNDRTWAYWGDSFPFDDVVTHRWERLGIFAPGGGTVTDGVSYRALPADAFYQRCRSVIERDERFNWVRGRVASIEPLTRADGSNSNTAETARVRVEGTTPSAGFSPTTIVGDLVVDSVFGPAVGRGEAPSQRFVGWNVETPDDLWDVTEATLMDFVPSDRGLEFFYTLPTGPRTALVEYTVVAGSAVDRSDIEERLSHYVGAVVGNDEWRITRRESGEIPLFLDRVPGRSEQSPVLHLGVEAGAARPSTGYAFRSIVETSRGIVEGLREGWNVTVPVAANLHGRPRFFDRVFIELLRSEPKALPAALVALFKRNPSARVFRFLEGSSSFLDDLGIVRSLPWAPFLRGFGRVIASHLKRRYDAGGNALPELAPGEEPATERIDRHLRRALHAPAPEGER